MRKQPEFKIRNHKGSKQPKPNEEKQKPIFKGNYIIILMGLEKEIEHNPTPTEPIMDQKAILEFLGIENKIEVEEKKFELNDETYTGDSLSTGMYYIYIYI